MKKDEFLRSLRGKITGKMPQDEVERQIEYYSSYIDGEISRGRPEETVLEDLGDPLIIAKTLYEASDGGYLDTEYISDGADYNNTGSGNHTAGASSGESQKNAGDHKKTYGGFYNRKESFGKKTGINKEEKEIKKAATKMKIWLIAVLIAVIAIVVLIFMFVFKLGIFLFSGFLPFIIVALIVVLVIGIFRKR